MSYKPSRYNCTKVTDRIAIFNSFSGSLTILSKDDYTKLLHIAEYSSSDADVQEFLNQGLIVEENDDELAVVNYSRYSDTFLKKKPTFRIMTTTACNARCFYCYEKVTTSTNMSLETALNVAKFIKNASEGVEQMTLNWFGGEPLLNPDVITLISREVSSCMKDTKVFSSMITNASLFTEELMGTARNVWNVRNIQITMDGLAVVHEKRKAYTNNANSFTKTIDIVGSLLSKGFHVSLRLNYDKKNLDDIVQLVFFIKETFGNPFNLSCYAYPLFSSSSCYNASFLSVEDIPIYEPIVKEALVSCGYYNSLKTLPRRTTACFATDPYSYVINTDGLLYKCTMDMADKSRAVGDVYDGVEKNVPFIEWTTPVVPKKCLDCILLPVCQGGCRAGRILNLDMNDCAIKQQAVEYTLNHLLSTKAL